MGRRYSPRAACSRAKAEQHQNVLVADDEYTAATSFFRRDCPFAGPCRDWPRQMLKAA